MTDSVTGTVGAILDAYLQALEEGRAPPREELLAQHPQCAAELAAALDGLEFIHRASREMPRAPKEGGELAERQLLGDFRLVREVGRGGMAVVYEAVQVSLGRRVALKVLPFAAVLDPKQLQRFKNEALAAAHLHHPHIVPVFAVGCERGVHYYAMQLVEGQSLAAVIREMKESTPAAEPKTPATSHGSNKDPGYVRMAVTLGVQAAEALDHAHQLGVVHRDVKPGNLLVDSLGELWVTDFGLARTLRDGDLTVTGELLGTYRYMSPEQTLAKRAPMDHRTDVYSLGVTLYELLTLEHAFPGDDPHAVMRDIAEKEPVAPRRFNDGLAVDLETIVLKAMSKDPSSRYSTALEMAEDLGRYLEDRPILARRPSVAARASKWMRRHRGFVAAAFVVLLVGVAALAVDAVRVQQEQGRTKKALDQANANLGLARSAVDKFLVETGIAYLTDGPLPRPSRVALLQSALSFYSTYQDDFASLVHCSTILHALRRYDEALTCLDRALAMRPDLAEEIWRAHMLTHLGRSDEAVKTLDRLAAAKPDTADAHYHLGVAFGGMERFEEALAAHDRAIALDPKLPYVHAARGNVLESLGRHEDALPAFDRAIALEPYNSEALTGRGNALQSLDRLPEALGAYDRAIAVDPDFPAGYIGRGETLSALGRFEEALAAYERAAALAPDSARAQTDLGNTYQSLGRVDEALAAQDRAIALDPGNARCHYNRGVSLWMKGDVDGAIGAYNEAIRILPNYAKAHCNLSDALSAKGDFSGEVRELGVALQIDPDLPEAHNNLGGALWRDGDIDGAIREYRAAIRVRPGYAKAHCNLGLALMRQGRFREALPSLREGHELGSRIRGWNAPSKAWLEDAERKAGLEERLDGILTGEGQPRDALERIEFAELLYAQSRHAESAKMYDEAFSEAPALAEDLKQGHRYNAACSTVLAAVNGAPDAAAWRERALQWLRADLAARQAAGDQKSLPHWKEDLDFKSVRDEIAALPAGEREAWKKLWGDVENAISAQ